MSDTSGNKGQDEAARQRAQDRRTDSGKEARAFGPGGNPLKQNDDGTWVDESGNPVATPVDESGNPVV